MKTFLNRCLRFIVAAVIGFICASVFHTQSVLYRLSQLGIEISFAERLVTNGKDILGLAPTYGLVMLIGLLIAFIVAGLAHSKFGGNAYLWFALAGAVCMLTILAAMKPFLEVTLLAGARDTVGLLLQTFAGCLAGLLFIRLRKTKLLEQKQA